MRVFLDDVRNPPAFDSLTGEPLNWDMVIRDADELISLVRSGQVCFISFDHDLGSELTGYDVACEIEKLAQGEMIAPIDYSIHSANPVGSNNIDSAMKSAWRFWEKEK